MKRLKLSLLPPLVSQTQNLLLPIPQDIETISQLRKHIFRSLSTVRDGVQSSKEIRLEIEGFELLPGSEVDIIQDGDVVIARTADSSSHSTLVNGVSIDDGIEGDSIVVIGTKRKVKARASTLVPKSKKVKMIPSRVVSATATPALAPLPPSSSSSSQTSSSSVSTSSSSSSASSPSSSSSTSSVSESSSSSSTSSTSSSAPNPSQSKPSTRPPYPNQTNSIHIPPGKGKPSTQLRNLRRRKARLMKKLSGSIPFPSLPSHSNTQSHILTTTSTLPTNPHSNLMEETSRSVLLPLPFDLPRDAGNPNKRGDYLRQMGKIQATKTIFSPPDSPHQPVANEPTAGSGTIVDPEQTLCENVEHWRETVNGNVAIQEMTESAGGIRKNKRGGRIVPPSEKILPDNMFVTSVDFSHTGTRNREGRMSFSQSQDQFMEAEGSFDIEEIDEGQHGTWDGVMVGTKVNGVDREGGGFGSVDDLGVRDEAEKGLNGVNGHEENDQDQALWTQAESEYDNLPLLTPMTFLSFPPKDILVWKELELNMITYTPELRIHLARLIPHYNFLSKDEETHEKRFFSLQFELLSRPSHNDEYEGWDDTDPIENHDVEDGGEGKEKEREKERMELKIEDLLLSKWRVMVIPQ
ncbi:hypothetical protein TREMEDRAFT_63059 [Tremella mesenterica DSM 1558]|uniref:uncharacterized protein n=1 Tax=Tremella mesenterica (strain ATCC 24925 / CBS 8224 / DSM 1558 / NBRC 9311 / NRRL Y-6157 / RJB 2259-6 / UBC 559-6) TaxID=578456 RepID=UPI0003F49232|nr:uncharacterized protein TREMEDRAFT_63059 [Tremella mesenterica DSM 1558]EIW68592.1 hypothetical protein TREMEDRAFT_63059 [Tremella mesenterica DSM 1558]